MRYSLLKYKFTKLQRDLVIDNLIALREQLDADIPDKDSEHNLLLATWNVRDLGKVDGKESNRRGFGKRILESHFYIAEVISRFDFVAVQEVNDLAEWEMVMDILGGNWDYIATDVTDPKLGGNGERLTFAFDRRKVKFCNIAGEIVLPNDMLITNTDPDAPDEQALFQGKQFRRTPFLASFQSGWFKFDVCTVHLYYGSASGPQLKERINEINRIAKYLSARANQALSNERALLLLGDFNIVHPEHKTMKALINEGFTIPKALQVPSNLDRTKYYDQIAFKTKPEVLEYIDRASTDPKKKNAGLFELYNKVFTEEKFEQYKEELKKTPNGKNKDGEALKKYYLEWRTYQFSDHKPMWVRLSTNDSKGYLERLRSKVD
ncbi:hypothetical protein GCM10027347_55960 [Larkinella harenae]